MPTVQRYVSDELTHFVGGGKPTPDKQYRVLVKILGEGWITHPPHKMIKDSSGIYVPQESGNLYVDWNARLSHDEMYIPQVVCFCDIPIEDLQLHISKYSPFGVSFAKKFLVQKGANPVFYVANDSQVRKPEESTMWQLGPSQKWSNRNQIEYTSTPRSELFDQIIKEYHQLFDPFKDHSNPPSKQMMDVFKFLEFQLFSFMKCFDSYLADEDPRNYYMEREWRVLGNVRFTLDDVERIIIPKGYEERLRQDVPEYSGQITVAGVITN